jgi:predicted TIM-barrel fold metal-dependent hydrolase
MQLNRRQFLHRSMLAAAAASATPGSVSGAQGQAGSPAANRPPLIDTNVHVFEWPFRKLKYAQPAALAEKLRRHGVTQAWAASFEALFAKDIAGANARLVEGCARSGKDFFVPVGSVNPLWPGWAEDLRRIHEVHRLGIIRLHPCYHGYALSEPGFAELLVRATERKLLVQIVLEMEDPRVHHPAVRSPSANPAPLVSLLPKIPGARIQLLGDQFTWMRMPAAKPLLTMANVAHDFSALEGVGGVGRLLQGKHWHLAGKIPLERMVFGSHAPYFPVESALLKLFEAPFSAAEMQALMAGNARRLLATA